MLLSIRFVAFLAQVAAAVSRVTCPSNYTELAPHTLFVAHQKLGILSLSFDPAKQPNNSLNVVSSQAAGTRPGWLELHGDLACSISRTGFPDASVQSGGIFTFRKTSSGSNTVQVKLANISNASSDGEGGVYCGISKDGRTMSAANIDGSTVSIHPLHRDGTVGNASFVFTYTLSEPGPGTNDSQVISNPHQAIFDPTGRYMFVPDRGADLLYVYTVEGPYNVTKTLQLEFPPGTGPRHITFSPMPAAGGVTFMYLVSELDNTLRVFELAYQRSSVSVVQIQVLSTLGSGSNRTEPDNRQLASEVALSYDGRYAYVANRNTVTLASDTIAIYTVEWCKTASRATARPQLTYLGQSTALGKIPRHFSLSKDDRNRYVAVAHEVSNELVVFSRSTETGFLGDVVGRLSFGAPDLTQQIGPMTVIWA